jgi:transposase
VGERQLGQELVPDELWKIVEPPIPPQRERPQGGSTRYIEDRAVFTAIVYVLTTGCAWRHLPAEFGVSKATAHRRFVAWTAVGLHRAVLDRLGEQAGIDWSCAVVDAASVRAKERESFTGPNPVDRSKPGSKLHVLTDATGLPLAVAVSAANTHDSLALIPLVQAIPGIHSRRGPRRRRPDKLHADKGYDYQHLRDWLR